MFRRTSARNHPPLQSRIQSEDGIKASAWQCVQTGSPNRILFEGKCNIGNKSDIEDGEIHALQEGLAALGKTKANLGLIYLCVENENALRSLSGGQTSGREYVRKYLEEIEILQHWGCEIFGKWSPSHQKITGNDRADTMAKEGLQMTKCEHTRTPLTWARSQPRKILNDKWARSCKSSERGKPFSPTVHMPRNASGAIARLRC